ncbi:MAG TPA: hypothetical protein VIK86_04970 [Candidatus Paceibacterota bacterium]
MDSIAILLLPLTLIYSLPFTLLFNFPAVVVSLIILLIIFNKKLTKENIFIFLYRAKPEINTQVEKTGSSDSVFKSSKNIYYRYVAIMSFFLIIIIGSYDPIFSCSYLYKMFVNIAAILSFGVLIKIISDIFKFYNIKLSRFIKTLIAILVIYFLSFILFKLMGPLNFGDGPGKITCYFNSF